MWFGAQADYVGFFKLFVKFPAVEEECLSAFLANLGIDLELLSSLILCVF
jgi:hypothetical protein